MRRLLPSTPLGLQLLLEEAKKDILSGEREVHYPPSLEGLGKAVHLRINEIRQNHGLTRLHWSDELEAIARSHSYDMAMRNYFSHVDPQGRTFQDRYSKRGYTRRKVIGRQGRKVYYSIGGENIFLTSLAKWVYSDGSISSYHTRREILRQVVNGWMKSPGHRKNILTPYWDYEGIGVAVRIPEGRVYVTQNFS